MGASTDYPMREGEEHRLGHCHRREKAGKIKQYRVRSTDLKAEGYWAEAGNGTAIGKNGKSFSELGKSKEGGERDWGKMKRRYRLTRRKSREKGLVGGNADDFLHPESEGDGGKEVRGGP